MEIKENTVYNCDCIELMKEMVKQGIVVDWLIADPPYGIDVSNLTYFNPDTTKGGKAKATLYTSISVRTL